MYFFYAFGFFSYIRNCYRLNCVLPKKICWCPKTAECDPQNVTLFGDQSFIEVTELKWGHSHEPYSSMTGGFIKRGKFSTETDIARGMRMWRDTTRFVMVCYSNPTKLKIIKEMFFPLSGFKQICFYFLLVV